HDYRALAEGLRVQLFWNILGLTDRVHEKYLTKQQSELEWIRRALFWWQDHDHLSAADQPPSPEQSQARKDLVRRRWVQAQFIYLAQEAGPREERKGKHCKRWSAILFWMSLGLSLAVGGWEVVNFIQSPEHQGQAEHDLGLHPVEKALVVSVSLLLAGA